MGLVKEILRQLQHIVGITALWTVQIADILLRLVCWQEVLAHAIASDTYGTILYHIFPKIVGSLLIRVG